LQIRWSADAEEIQQAVDLFIQNTTTDYISHGEVQSGRALNIHQWSPLLHSVLSEEFTQSIENKEPGVLYRLGMAHYDGKLAGMMFVEIQFDGKAQYAVLQDMVVDSSMRDKKIGRAMLSWLEADLKNSEIRWLFLESGIHKHRAHSFFEHNGFEICSKMMVKDLVNSENT
jgi:GNAT superfamily N-acetyltransferase